MVDGDKWTATKELIEAIPDQYLAAFVPQVGNGLCAAAVVDDLGDGLGPLDALGGQCMGPSDTGAPWSLALMDAQLKRADGSPKLDWLGVQYYNAGPALCCGGGTTAAEESKSAAQNYKNLALGWPGVTVAEMASGSPWETWRWWPGPWAGFDGIGADRLVLGKPGCNGCAGSNYLGEANMESLLRSVGSGLGGRGGTFGGVLFWDLCRLFGTDGKFCVSSHCQPGWGGTTDVLGGLQQLASVMQSMPTASGTYNASFV